MAVEVPVIAPAALKVAAPTPVTVEVQDEEPTTAGMAEVVEVQEEVPAPANVAAPIPEAVEVPVEEPTA